MATAHTVYITGGSSGIGLALAERYARAGDNLVLLARNQAKLDTAVQGLRAITASAQQIVVGVSLDVSDTAALPSAMAKIAHQYGLPDVLILSAGDGVNARFLDTPASEFERLMTVNFIGSRELARAALPDMLQRKAGHIVFISSMAGIFGIYGYTAYAASKFAVRGLVESLQQEMYGSGVVISLICPGEVATPMIAGESAGVLPQTRLLKDLAGTLSIDRAADLMFKAISKRKALIIPGALPQLMDWTHRHLPGVFRWACRLAIAWAGRKGK